MASSNALSNISSGSASSLDPQSHKQYDHTASLSRMCQSHSVQKDDVTLLHKLKWTLQHNGVETIPLGNSRWLWIMMLLDQLHYFLEFELCWQLGGCQTADKLISCWTTDTEKYCSLLVCIFNFVSCQILHKALYVSSPSLLSTGELWNSAMSCHLDPHRHCSILTACKILWINNFYHQTNTWKCTVAQF